LIPRPTVDKIIDAAHVEEVVGEFVTLKKRGANLLGLCPFHGEKTPSFTVSPVKGIYKCFGCGKAGNSVNFVMDHLKLSYPEALKWLARKYGIEVVEKELTPEEREQQTERESMLIVMQYAARYFTEQMMETDEGRSIGLGYFKERGLRDEIIARFQLGYSPEARNAFGKAAVAASYKPKYLVKTGMSILSNRYTEGKEITEHDIFDRYAGRVMFPIHDDGGRVVAFGGRTLSNDKKTAKYINSPETDIYNKSRILYGLWLGKKSIQDKDSCFLVEGYMDVIAMHQAGIENVVASSGTSLTVDQIKSIHRFTRNIVVLYDGDAAGQKASNRAIPLLLEEGMNVRLLQFPDNDDPDSFSRKVGIEEFHAYLENNTVDFLDYKSRKLKEETRNDPIKKAAVVRDIVENIALIPDNIIRSVYIKTCASNMEMEELVLQQEVNKIRRKAAGKERFSPEPVHAEQEPGQAPPDDLPPPELTPEEPAFKFEAEERDLLRLILKYGNVVVVTDAEDEDSNKHEIEITLAEFILMELWRDEIAFENPIHQAVLDEYIHELSNHRLPSLQHFSGHADPLISSFTINQVIDVYQLSPGWEKKFGIHVPSQLNEAKRSAEKVLFSLKARILQAYKKDQIEKLKEASEETQTEIQREVMRFNNLIARVSKLLGRIVIR
jgi:DNA primase